MQEDLGKILDCACLRLFLDKEQVKGRGAEAISKALNHEFEKHCKDVDPEILRQAIRAIQELPPPPPQQQPSITLGHRRKQYPVGQGGLHAGTVRKYDRKEIPSFTEASSPSFFYVYDCGSDPRVHVDREIRKLHAEREGRALDMLFVSHFDRDHICGMPHLLAEDCGFKVDTVVMPYVDDVERMVAFGKSAQTLGDANAESFFADMVVDPISTVRRFNPRQIIFIREGGESPDPERLTAGMPTGPDEGEPRWGIISTEGSVRSWSLDGGGAFVVQEPVFEVFDLLGVGGWILKPYVDRADSHVVESFQRIAEEKLNWDPGTFARQVDNPDTRRDLVTRHRTIMARAYRFAFHDRNTTSLCLYSGPRNPEYATLACILPKSDDIKAKKVAWMGTGDADLKDAKKIDRFELHYRDEIQHISTFMLPHHGSIKNSNPDRLVSDAEEWVVAADPHHDWAHPAPELVSSIGEKRGHLSLVKSGEETSLDEAVIVSWMSQGSRREPP